MLLVGYLYDHSNMKSVNALSMVVKWASIINVGSGIPSIKLSIMDRYSVSICLPSEWTHEWVSWLEYSPTFLPPTFHISDATGNISGRGECWNEYRECLTFPITSPAWHCMTQHKRISALHTVLFSDVWALKKFQFYNLLFQVWCMKERK